MPHDTGTSRFFPRCQVPCVFTVVRSFVACVDDLAGGSGRTLREAEGDGAHVHGEQAKKVKRWNHAFFFIPLRSRRPGDIHGTSLLGKEGRGDRVVRGAEGGGRDEGDKASTKRGGVKQGPLACEGAELENIGAGIAKEVELPRKG